MVVSVEERIPTLRGCIVAPPDYTFLSLDAVQIELKVAAILSGDPAMIEDSRTVDMHMATAIRVFGWIDDPVEMKVRRYNAKQLNFAILYGAEAFKVAEMSGKTEEEAQDMIDLYFRTYPVLYQWTLRIKQEARANKYVVNMFGRIRPLPDMDAGSWKVRAKAEREAVNTLVQGTASDIIKKMMLYLRNILSRDIRLVLQVHDEILWECPDSKLQEAIVKCRELELAFPDYPCHVSTGKVYGEMEELHFNGNN